MGSTVLSVRIRRELKEEAERLGIDIRAVIEKALEKEIERVRMERLSKLIDEAMKSMKVGIDEWVKLIKESRTER